MAKKLITPAEINEKNREFWAEASAQFTENLRKRPHDAVISAEQEARMVSRLAAAFGPEFVDKAIAVSESMEQRVADLARSHTAEQKRRAQGKRPRQSPSCRSVTIEAMRRARASGQALDDFLDAAKVGSIEGLNILQREHVKPYRVTADAVEKEQDVAVTTIREWWTAAGGLK